jgi:hypothetical protein
VLPVKQRSPSPQAPLGGEPTVLQTCLEQALTCTAAAGVACFGTHSAQRAAVGGDAVIDVGFWRTRRQLAIRHAAGRGQGLFACILRR